MPKDIERILLNVLSSVTALPPPGLLTCLPVGGGSINHTYQVLTNFNNRWFCKFNDSRHFPDLFAKENSGLALLRDQQLIRVPATVACSQIDDTQVLVLEWIDQAPRTTLFGGFDPAFYDAYNHHYPFPSNHRQQWEIANLYPLLIHLNLFGSRPSSELLRHTPPGSYPSPALGYLRNILHTIQQF